MHCIQSKDNLSSVKTGLIFSKSLLLHQQIEQLSSWAVFQHEKEFSFVLERIKQLDNETVVKSNQDITFGDDMFLLLLVVIRFLLDDFQSIDLVIILFTDQDYFGVTAFSQTSNQTEIIYGYFLVFVDHLYILTNLHYLYLYNY